MTFWQYVYPKSYQPLHYKDLYMIISFIPFNKNKYLMFWKENACSWTQAYKMSKHKM